jgi:DNA-binding beta-propeller fold protein YncE
MSRKVRAGLATAGCMGVVAAGAFAGPAGAHPAYEDSGSGLVFMQTNDVAGNSVAVYDRRGDGALAEAGTYATGGLGGALDGPNFDQLASQGSVAYDGEHGLLYVVNAGSNSVTVFAVQGTQLRRVQVIGSGGVFPVSVAVHGAVVYVLNARDGGNIQGFARDGDRLIQVPEWRRGLALDTSITPEFLATPGDVVFTPAGDKLVVTTKNNDKIEVFNLDSLGRPSASPVLTPDPGTVQFAATFDAAGHLDVAEAAGSVASFVVNRDGSLTLIGRQATHKKATCWITSTGDHVFASDTASDTVSRYATQADGLVGRGLTPTDAAPTDSAASSDGRYLYVRAGGAGEVEEFAIGQDGALTRIGAVPTPGGVAGDGMAAG